jgi:hypothetical protein
VYLKGGASQTLAKTQIPIISIPFSIERVAGGSSSPECAGGGSESEDPAAGPPGQATAESDGEGSDAAVAAGSTSGSTCRPIAGLATDGLWPASGRDSPAVGAPAGASSGRCSPSRAASYFPPPGARPAAAAGRPRDDAASGAAGLIVEDLQERIAGKRRASATAPAAGVPSPGGSEPGTPRSEGYVLVAAEAASGPAHATGGAGGSSTGQQGGSLSRDDSCGSGPGGGGLLGCGARSKSHTTLSSLDACAAGHAWQAPFAAGSCSNSCGSSSPVSPMPQRRLQTTPAAAATGSGAGAAAGSELRARLRSMLVPASREVSRMGWAPLARLAAEDSGAMGADPCDNAIGCRVGGGGGDGCKVRRRGPGCRYNGDGH